MEDKMIKAAKHVEIQKRITSLEETVDFFQSLSENIFYLIVDEMRGSTIGPQ
jgi:hypothetical protein